MLLRNDHLLHWLRMLIAVPLQFNLLWFEARINRRSLFVDPSLLSLHVLVHGVERLLVEIINV